VLETHGRGEELPPLIGELRQRYKTFRALQEELDVLACAEPLSPPRKSD
jgi:hypothetical protein